MEGTIVFHLLYLPRLFLFPVYLSIDSPYGCYRGKGFNIHGLIRFRKVKSKVVRNQQLLRSLWLLIRIL